MQTNQPVMRVMLAILCALLIPTTAYAQGALEIRTGALGDAVAMPGYVLTVKRVARASSYAQGWIKPDPGHVFVSVYVEIEVSDDDATAGPWFAQLRDADGYVTNPTLGWRKPALDQHGRLRSGDRVAGWITFQVPSATRHATFRYEPWWPNDGVALDVPVKLSK
jgi:hypothetical protein